MTKPSPRQPAISRRGIWARTNHAAPYGFKGNYPDGWVDTNGPVWWYGSDNAYLAPDMFANGFAAITKATSVIVNTLASGDWVVPPGISTRWIDDPMLCRPDGRFDTPVWPASRRLPRPIFWGQFIRSALLAGMGYLIYYETEPGATPWPGSMWVLNPAMVDSGDYFNTGRRRIRLDSGYGYGEAIELDNENRFTFRGMTWRLLEMRNPTLPVDAVTGATPGVLEYHAAELGLLGAITDYTLGTFAGAGVPSGYLKIDSPQITQKQADDTRNGWMAAHGGSRRTVAVLNAATSYTPVAVSPVDASLADMKKLSLVDVANAFGVPYGMLGAPPGHSMTYNNPQMDRAALWHLTLPPWVTAVESTLSSLLPVGVELSIRMPALEGVETNGSGTGTGGTEESDSNVPAG